MTEKCQTCEGYGNIIKGDGPDQETIDCPDCGWSLDPDEYIDHKKAMR